MKRQKTEIDIVLNSLITLQNYYKRPSKFYLYGSHIYKTSTAHSDLNIYFDFEQKYKSRAILPKKVQGIVMRKLQKAMTDDPASASHWTDLKCLVFDETAIQLLTAVHKQTNIRCTFTFDSSVPIHVAELINYYITLSPVCRDLIIFIKEWLRKHNLAIRGYVVTILVIVFLQRLDILPSVHSLQQGKRMVRGCKLDKFGE